MCSILFLLILGCSQSLYIPGPETVSDTAMISELSEGRLLYISNCGGCHNLYRPEKFTTDHWTNEMVEMKEEAKITDQEAALILKYLTGYKPVVVDQG